MLPYDFPSNFNELGTPALGSIDEVSWICADGSGSDPDAVRRGSALYVRGWATNIDRDGATQAIVLRIDDDAT
jgi:hypothetical protein